MKLLITGGAGFIGSAVIREALQMQKYEVINLDCLTYAGNLESLTECYNHSNYSFEKADICNSNEVKKIINYYEPNAIMHLAAESHVDRSIDGPAAFINTNINGTFILLEAARKYYEGLDDTKKKQFVFHHISTDEVYGDLGYNNHLFTEKTAYSPSSPYSASKAASDHLVRSWGRTYGLPIIITNCSNNYGPFHFPEKLIPHTILSGIQGKSIPIYGDGMQIRDWLYVEDHAKALLKVVSRGKIGESYNIGGFSEKTNLEVVESICLLLEELAPIKPSGIQNYRDLINFVKDRPGHDTRYAIDASKIKTELQWLPEETFETGLRKTVNWYLDNRSWWERVLSGEYRFERLGELI